MTPLRRLSIIALIAVAGCASRQSTDLLEARLREQEDRLYQVQSDLTDAQRQIAQQRRENNSLREQLAGRQPVQSPEQTQAIGKAEGIRLNRWMTGGLDRDGKPGDDVVNVVLAPHDAQGELVKLPGEIDLELLDMSKPHTDRQLGRWKYTSDEAGEHWHKGALSSGYVFELPISKTVGDNPFTLVARMSTSDGRRFTASQQIRIAGTPQDASKIADDSPEKPPKKPAVLFPVRPASATATTPSSVAAGGSESEPKPFPDAAATLKPVVPAAEPQSEKKDEPVFDLTPTGTQEMKSSTDPAEVNPRRRESEGQKTR